MHISKFLSNKNLNQQRAFFLQNHRRANFQKSLLNTELGSFRASNNIKDNLPTSIYQSLFESKDILTLKQNIPLLIEEKNSKKSYLNNGAFGKAYKDCYDLSLQLYEFQETHPDIFYDQCLIPLLKNSLNEAEKFFGTQNVVLIPNSSAGLKSILDTLKKENENFAYLSPLYGATQKLLKSQLVEGQSLQILEVPNFRFQENASQIIDHLNRSKKQKAFQVLFCDKIASQTGRILPTQQVYEWCQDKKVVLVVDGTQAFEFEDVNNCDYWVMSTHKWLGNIKTAGFLIYKENAQIPNSPIAVSFGFDPEDIKSSFLWTGMYNAVPSIMAAKSLQIFSKYGPHQVKTASNLLKEGFENLGAVPLLPFDKNRTMNIFELKNQGNLTSTELQNIFQDYGVHVSVKKFEDDKELKGKHYIRVSSWNNNKLDDFLALKNVIQNNISLDKMNKEQLKHQLLRSWDLTDKLFSVLKPKGHFLNAEKLRHQLIFYLGHTSCFWVNKLVTTGFIDQTERINPYFEQIFAIGVDEMSWDDISCQNYEWCKLKNELEMQNYIQKVKQYRLKVKELVLKLIDQNDINLPIKQDSIWWIFLMGISHENIHLETTSCIIQQVPVDLINKENDWPFQPYPISRSSESIPKENKLVTVKGGKLQISKNDNFYGWDNEFGFEEKELKDFQVSQMLVSNKEYLEFIQDGGYSNQSFWCKDGWKYVQNHNSKVPRWWINQDKQRLLLEEVPIQWNFPVEVNNLEAQAFCKWKSSKLQKDVRLISHDEHYWMRLNCKNEQTNTNRLQYGSPSPVDKYCGQIDNTQVFDISGNIWRHSGQVLTLMKGFKTHSAYQDFTLPTIDGEHFHILGGSWQSTGNVANLQARYGFRPHFYQFAGIRYVVSENSFHNSIQKVFPSLVGIHITEGFQDFNQETELQRKPVKNFPQILGQNAVKYINQEKLNKKSADQKRVLIMHGGVGGTTFEIIKGCQNLFIDHTDFTADSIQVLDNLLKYKKVSWEQQTEGSLTDYFEFSIDEDFQHSCEINFTSNVHINEQLQDKLKNYDFIVCDIRFKNAEEGIKKLIQRLNKNGLLILTSIDKFDKLQCMEAIENNTYYPHIKMETKNKHEYIISNFSVWRKVQDEDLKIQEKKIQLKNEYSYDKMDYEDLDILKSYEQLHFGNGFQSVPNFPVRIAKYCIDICEQQGIKKINALDAGSGPGGSTFEFANYFKQVEAFDYSQNFVTALLQKKDEYKKPNVIAFQGDAHDLSSLKLKEYNLIFACNLIDRLHTPIQFLNQAKQLISREGGLIAIASPYTWREEFTPSEQWIGGFQKAGEPVYTSDGLKQIMFPEFSIIDEIKIPMVIPNKNGSFQYTYSNLTIFRNNL